MIVDFIANKYKKCLYVHYQEHLYIEVNLTREVLSRHRYKETRILLINIIAFSSDKVWLKIRWSYPYVYLFYGLLFTSMWFMDLFSQKIIFYSSSRQRCSVKKGVLINCTNSQENTCAKASFLINSQAWGLQLSHMYFPVNFAKFSRTPYLHNTSGWLLLILSVACFFYFPLSNIFATKKGASCEKIRLVENRLNLSTIKKL